MQPGVYKDLPNADYHKNPALGKTGITIIDQQSVWAYNQIVRVGAFPIIPDRPMVMGAALHCLTLEPHLFDSEYKVVEGNTINDNELSKDEYQHVCNMSESLASSNHFAILKNCTHEQSFFWNDEKTGLPMKCRPDSTGDGYLVNIKTARSAQIEKFRAQAFNFDYHTSAYLDLHGVSHYMETPKRYYFLVVENRPPYGVARYYATKDQIALGKSITERSIEKLSASLKSDEWPTYTKRTCGLGLPPWYRKRGIVI